MPVFRKLADLGVCGLTIAEDYGGAGRDLVAAVAVIDELARRGSAIAGPYIHCAFYGGLNISENGSEAQKQALLPRLARGELHFAYGLSEPDIGGDLASVAMSARRSDDGGHVETASSAGAPAPDSPITFCAWSSPIPPARAIGT
jgi:alkylation response protein AidB-like acyl-CoA dehydrogenase